MKFGHFYSRHLLKDGFPPHWVDSAISYRELKKCIKRVEDELSTIGLDAQALGKLLKSAEDERPRYDFQDGDEAAHEIFKPKLLFAVDEATGQPVDAGLSPETKDYLHQLAISENLSTVRITDAADVPEPKWMGDSQSRQPSRSVRLVEVPLTSDGEFFNILHRQLSGLAALQSEEKDKLSTSIADLGCIIAKLTSPTDTKTRHDLSEWRKVFEKYLDSRVFVATNEQDHGSHGFAVAQKNFTEFLNVAHQAHFKKKESLVALQKFVAINAELLQNLRFLELNEIAIAKIIKKFDKRTGLNVKTSLPHGFFVGGLDMAKALSAQVSSQILAAVPQLNDYLCPICFSIAYRPVRLKCSHVFCIRCLIVMQRERKDKCPLCRTGVVMQADSMNLDPALAEFLKKYFPAEVKAKQRENEEAVARDQFGELYDAKCVVM